MRARLVAVSVAGIAVASLAACGSTPPDPAPTSPSPATTSATPAPTPSPTPTPQPPAPAPVRPGTARGELLVVQRAEDASLVSGGDPIRLTLARTQNLASWFAAPPQRLAGSMTTQQAMLTLGWRPSDVGTTAAMPRPTPNAVLATANGDLAFSIAKVNVRSDGTLVLDIVPIGGTPDTNASLGPVTLSMDGVPGVLALPRQVTPDLSTRVIVTGRTNQQAVVQFVGPEGKVEESAFVALDMPSAVTGDIQVADTSLTDVHVEFQGPKKNEPGKVTISGNLTYKGQSTVLSQIVARWSLPTGTPTPSPSPSSNPRASSSAASDDSAGS